MEFDYNICYSEKSSPRTIENTKVSEMLIQFNVKNHKSIKNEISLDLSATGQEELISHTANVGYEKLLKFAVIFGANASGKSKIIDAFYFMSRYVIQSFLFDEEEKNDGMPPILKQRPFLLCENFENESSTYEVFFINQNDEKEKTYQYGFELGKSGIVSEWLYSKAKSSKEFRTIFYRENQEIEIEKKALKKYHTNLSISLSPNTLLLSLGAKLRIKEFADIRDWFIDNDVMDFGDVYENVFRGRSLPDDLKRKKSNVVKYINSFTKSMLKDLELTEENNEDEENNEKWYQLETIHINKRTGHETKLSFSDESSGTQKMFALYQPIKDALKYGSVLFVDELNGRLHPLLIRSIIQVFADKKKNPKNAQLILTSHDAWLLEDNIFRRDEIWFAEKNIDQETNLYSLAEFEDINGNKIRSDENYMRNYLLGKYGGIPDFHELAIDGGEDEEE